MRTACAGTERRSRGVGWAGARRFALGIALTAAVAAGGPLGAQGAGKVTVAFDNMAAADAIAQFRWVAGVAIVSAPAPETRIGLSMLDVPVEEALTALCEQAGLRWTRVGRVYVLEPPQRARLLPTPGDLEQRVLHAERQRVDAARLLLTLSPDQAARAAGGERLGYHELSPRQQELLAGIYAQLLTAARSEWVAGGPGLAFAPAAPPSDLAFVVRGHVWRMEPPTAAAPPTPPAEQAEPGELEDEEAEPAEPLPSAPEAP